MGGPSVASSSAVHVEDLILGSSLEASSLAVHVEDLMLGISPPSFLCPLLIVCPQLIPHLPFLHTMVVMVSPSFLMLLTLPCHFLLRRPIFRMIPIFLLRTCLFCFMILFLPPHQIRIAELLDPFSLLSVLLFHVVLHIIPLFLSLISNFFFMIPFQPLRRPLCLLNITL